MVQKLTKPDSCIEVHSKREHILFDSVLTKYNRSCSFRQRYHYAPHSIRAFCMTNGAGNPVAAAALYDHDPWNRTITLSHITTLEEERNELIPALQWITGIAMAEMGADKVCTFVAEDSPEYAFVYLAAGYSYDGFLRNHLPLPNGRRSDVYLISILKHEYERQHLWHCKLSGTE